MKNISYNKKCVYKLTVKGKLSDDCSFITYIDDDKNDQDITIEKCLANYAGENVTLSIALDENEDMTEDIYKD